MAVAPQKGDSRSLTVEAFRPIVIHPVELFSIESDLKEQQEIVDF